MTRTNTASGVTVVMALVAIGIAWPRPVTPAPTARQAGTPSDPTAALFIGAAFAFAFYTVAIGAPGSTGCMPLPWQRSETWCSICRFT